MNVLALAAVGIRRSRTPERLLFAAAIAGLLVSVLLSASGMPRAEAAYSGRNGLIVFDVRKADPVRDSTRPFTQDWDLFTVTPGGAGLRQLTNGPETDLNPDWSPDGTQIAFGRGLADLPNQDIYVMNADGSELMNLTPDTPAFDDWGPSWSPDGDRIAFSSSRAESPATAAQGPLNDGLYVMNADGTDVVQIADSYAIGAEWSPDGSAIAVAKWDTYAIDLITPDGSHRKTLVRFPGRYVAYPDWSPDGRRLVFSSGALNIGGPPGDIWTIDRDGHGLINLTDSSKVSDVSPNWSPDGRFIVFVSDRKGRNSLYRMNADGSHVVPLVDVQISQDTRPDWGPRP